MPHRAKPSTLRSNRARSMANLPAALLALGLAAPGHAGDKYWIAGNGDWDNPANWSPFGVPGSDDEIYLGNMPGVDNSTVMLQWPGTGFDYLEVSDGMVLDMNNNELISFDLCSIIGANSRIIARPAPAGINAHDFNGTLHVGPGAFFELADNVPVRVHTTSDSFGTILGRGSFEVATPTPFNNSGVIQPINKGGLTFNAGTFGTQLFDLDGSTGNGSLLLEMPFSSMTLNAEALTDTFGGTITMNRGTGLDMNLAQPWVADANCVINIEGDYNPAAASQIHGAPLTLHGTLNVNSFEAHLRVLSDITFEAAADVVVGYTDWFELDGNTTVAGGNFLQGNQSTIDFDGPTTIMGGTFNTNSPDPANGAIDFNGGTTYNGGMTVNGVARQYGNAFVGGASVINADTFDMDGFGSTQWTVWADLVVNADTLQTNNVEDFHGTMTVASATGKLTVDLPPSDPLFSMAGTMNFVGHPGVFRTRYDGDALDLIGNLNVTHLVAMDGRLRAFGGTLDIATDAVLRLDHHGHFNSACTVTGDGELRIGPSSDPLFNDTNLNAVGLRNQGNLRFESFLMVDRYDAEPGSSWEVTLAGLGAGIDYDQLTAANAATLGGDLSVELFSGYLPDAADSFTILPAVSLAGAFDNVANGGRLATVDGEGSFLVSYGPVTNTVVLSDFATTPACPSDLTGDGMVGIEDFLMVLAEWGEPTADVDGDFNTGIGDFLQILANWGACPE